MLHAVQAVMSTAPCADVDDLQIFGHRNYKHRPRARWSGHDDFLHDTRFRAFCTAALSWKSLAATGMTKDYTYGST